MSSPEEVDDVHLEHEAQSGPQIKKRRIQTTRACDRCRLKKIRCDGSPTPGMKCSHCAVSESDCVFSPGVKQKRAPAKKYVDGLENRLERLEALLVRLHPDGDFSHELEGEPPSSATPISTPTLSSARTEGPNRFPHVLFDETHDIDTHDEQFAPSPELIEDEDEDDEMVADSVNIIRKLREMNITGPLNRYYGRSSSVRLYASALNMKSELSGQEQNILQEVLTNAERRPDFWKLHPWERSKFSREQKSTFVFPEPDLIHRLISVYFSLTHQLIPILHRPTFEADFAQGKHLYDEGFGTVVLLVCALSARFVDDPRVLLDHPDKPGHPHSAGWKWFSQVQLVRNVALADPTLSDLQCLALSIFFLSGTSPPQACWTLAGIGIRLAQDVGAHRRKTFLGHTLEGELWKRAFWTLVGLDINFSSFLGRPCAISLDSFDVDFPIDCDDEYWTSSDSSMAFKQPAGKPSTTSHMVCWVKLQLIHSHALRTIYSLEKHKVIAKIGEQEWEKRVVSELDSALNRWFDALPDHLRWDPNRQNEVHFFQTVCLHAAYHHVQMTIHRPFIPSSRKASSLSFPSLTICANSARACIHLLQAHERRLPGAIIMNLLIPAFMAGIVLLLRIWCAKRAGLKIDAEKEMMDVHHAINVISSGEEKWPLAGRFKDLLVTLSHVGDLPLPGTSLSSKRPHPESDEEGAPRSSTNPPSFPPTSGLAPASLRKASGSNIVSSALVQSPVSGESISTFGPPFDPHETSQSLFGPDMGSNSMILPTFNQPHPGGATRLHTGFSTPMSGPPTAGASNLSSLSSASSREASMSSSGFQPGLTSSAQTPYQHINDLYSLFGAPSQVPAAPDDTPTPPSSEASPAAVLGLGTDFYQYGNGLPLGLDTSTTSSPLNARSPPSLHPTDDLMKFFAPMVPQDGQMGVGSDMVTMWSTLPATYESEDWEKYVSNMVSLTGGASTGTSTSQQSQIPPQQQRHPSQQW